MTIDVGLDCRPLDPDQVPPYAELLKTITAADEDSRIMSEKEILDDFADPLMDFERGSLACYDGDQMIGYSILSRRSSADPVHDLYQWGGVHPLYRGRGIGSWLLDWAEDAAVRLHREHFPDRPASLECNIQIKNTPAIELFAARGYEQHRWFHEMMRDLSGELSVRTLPADVEVAGFTPERSADALLVRNEAFRDHWGSTEVTPESWDYHTSLGAFRPALSFVAYCEGEPIGFVMAHEYEAYNEKTGTRDVYFPLVGTRRAARGRGIASGLLTLAMRTATADGYDTATLDVDADSPTGAVGLYERLGFITKDTRVTVSRRLYEPGSAAS
ncbi:MAG TPA: GNAT family N-acetyltransferase [Streptosporangiaceae bacterium]|nr:GNAT family N-acetyltransferase [Streptosporangiaceae bacterium]